MTPLTQPADLLRAERLRFDHMFNAPDAMIKQYDDLFAQVMTEGTVSFLYFGTFSKIGEGWMHFQPADTPGVYSTDGDIHVGMSMYYVASFNPKLLDYWTKAFGVQFPQGDMIYPASFVFGADGRPNNWMGSLKGWLAAPQQPWLAKYGATVETNYRNIPAIV